MLTNMDFLLQFKNGIANSKPWFNHALYRLAERAAKVFGNLEKIFEKWFADGCVHVHAHVHMFMNMNLMFANIRHIQAGRRRLATREVGRSEDHQRRSEDDAWRTRHVPAVRRPHRPRTRTGARLAVLFMFVNMTDPFFHVCQHKILPPSGDGLGLQGLVDLDLGTEGFNNMISIIKDIIYTNDPRMLGGLGSYTDRVRISCLQT